MRLHPVIFTGVSDQPPVIWLDVFIRGGLGDAGDVPALDYSDRAGCGAAGDKNGFSATAGDFVAGMMIGYWVIGNGYWVLGIGLQVRRAWGRGN